MRYTVFATSLFASLSVAAALFPLNLFRESASLVQQSLLYLNGDQHVMNPGLVQNPVSSNPNDASSNKGSGEVDDSTISISDILPQTRKINIFASLTRDVSTVTDRLESTKPEDNTTLLAPLNSAMQALPRKPWEDRPDDDSGVSAERSEDKAAQNLKRFVEEHVVPTSPWQKGPQGKISTLGGQQLWWEEKDGHKIIMPGNLVVDGVVGRVGNGEVWAVKGVINYA